MTLYNQAFLRWIQRCNEKDLAQFIPFVVDGLNLGYVHQENVPKLLTFAGDFLYQKDEQLLFKEKYHDFSSRTQAMHTIAQGMLEHQIYDRLLHEAYDVSEKWGAPSLFTMDRVITNFFGVRRFGVHLNGYVLKDGQYYIWVAERAKDKPTWPGKLDHIVAGGHSAGLRVETTLYKECEEEAAIPKDLVKQATAVSYVSYAMQHDTYLVRDGLFIFDLQLDESFVPYNTDGEVDSFELKPIDEVLRLVATTEQYKTNCNLVIIDFALRHGFIQPDSAYYTQLQHYLSSENAL